MIKIFYGNIFISDLITNKSMTIEEMLEIIDFDAEAFKEKRGFESLDPADFRAVHFDFEKSLPSVEIQTEIIDNEEHRSKTLKINDKLELILYDRGQATLAYRHIEVETFYWDDEAERLFSDIDNVKISDLFAMMYRKRWISSVV